MYDEWTALLLLSTSACMHGSFGVEGIYPLGGMYSLTERCCGIHNSRNGCLIDDRFFMACRCDKSYGNRVLAAHKAPSARRCSRLVCDTAENADILISAALLSQHEWFKRCKNPRMQSSTISFAIKRRIWRHSEFRTTMAPLIKFGQSYTMDCIKMQKKDK